MATLILSPAPVLALTQDPLMTPTQQPHNKVDTPIARSFLLRFWGTAGRGSGRGEWGAGGERKGGRESGRGEREGRVGVEYRGPSRSHTPETGCKGAAEGQCDSLLIPEAEAVGLQIHVQPGLLRDQNSIKGVGKPALSMNATGTPGWA